MVGKVWRSARAKS